MAEALALSGSGADPRKEAEALVQAAMAHTALGDEEIAADHLRRALRLAQETEDPLDQILAAGLDVAFVGVTDLTVELGFDADRVNARVDEVRKAADVAGVALGAFVSEASQVPEGARYVAVSSDVSLLRLAAARAVSDGR